MAKVELEQETGSQAQSAPRPELVVGIPGLVDATHVRSVAAQWRGAGLRMAVVYPCEPGMRASHEVLDEGGSVQLVACEIAPGSSATPPWLGQPSVYAALVGEAESLGASACVILNPDLAAFTPRAVDALAHPMLEGECDLAMPLYPAGRFEGLLNQAILAPLTRALYGKRVRYPLAQDFALSAAFLPQLRAALSTPAGSQGLLWPATQAAVRDRKICQVHLPVHHENVAVGVDLSTLLQQVVAPLFADIEQNASVWQRVRGSQPTREIAGEAVAPMETTAETVPDPRPMVEAFLLGQRNLQELWSLVLPPVTLLDLKRLSRQPMESFRIADALWARVVYDFALAYRLRVLSRGHLLGALAPLYLGWVGSRVLEVGAAIPVRPRQEELERAFEQNKPYLVQRWRWPDRFNP
jgi:glucosylglycerate synthase